MRFADATISFLVPCVIIGTACIPLMLNAVPPNRFYGLRTRQTLADRELWFRVNRFGGCALFIAAAASAAVFMVAPEYASARSLVGLGIFLLPLAVAAAVSLVHLQRLSRRGQR
jgi:uncharacterized membrane protein